MAKAYRFIYLPELDSWAEETTGAKFERQLIAQMASYDIQMAGFVIKHALKSDENIPDGLVQVLRNGIENDDQYVIDIIIED